MQPRAEYTRSLVRETQAAERRVAAALPRGPEGELLLSGGTPPAVRVHLRVHLGVQSRVHLAVHLGLRVYLGYT